MNTELYNDIMKDVSKIISEKMNTERESRKLNNLCHDINFMYNKHSVIDGNAVINGIVPDEDDEYFHFSTSTETNLSKKKFRSVDYAIKYAQRHGFFKSEKEIKDDEMENEKMRKINEMLPEHIMLSKGNFHKNNGSHIPENLCFVTMSNSCPGLIPISNDFDNIEDASEYAYKKYIRNNVY